MTEQRIKLKAGDRLIVEVEAEPETPPPPPDPTPDPDPEPETPPPGPTEPVPAGALHVSAERGNDSNRGTESAPFKTLTAAFGRLEAGQTLLVHGGRYRENITGLALPPSTQAKRGRIMAAPGANPILEGLLWAVAPYWTFDGLDVLWFAGNGKDQHMVKLSGPGWQLRNAELAGARSFAALLISKEQSGYLVDRCYVHDTAAVNGDNQDHLIYINAYAAEPGVVQRCMLRGSPNGRAIKVGPQPTSAKVGNVKILHNTMLDNRGPSNVQLSYNARDVLIEGNLMLNPEKPIDTTNITLYSYKGGNNVARNNWGWGSSGVCPSSIDGGGNVHRAPEAGTKAKYGAAADV